MSIERKTLGGPEPKVQGHVAAAKVAVDATAVAMPVVPVDGAQLSAKPEPKHDPLATYGDPAHPPAEGAHSLLEDVAHGAHSPHGAMHAVEAGEHLLAPVARAAGRVLRTGASVAEVQPLAQAVVAESAHAGHALHQHHGSLVKAERWVSRVVVKGLAWTARGLRRLPGGKPFVAGVARVWKGPGRVMGPGMDAALQGTRLGQAVRFTGSGGRFVQALGGRLPIFGSVLGGVIAVVDVRDAIRTCRDPKQPAREKWLAGAQGSFSAISGVLGLGALAAAGAIAIGLTAPVSVPALLLGAAVTGVVAFGLSLFRGGAKGH